MVFFINTKIITLNIFVDLFINENKNNIKNINNQIYF